MYFLQPKVRLDFITAREYVFISAPILIKTFLASNKKKAQTPNRDYVRGGAEGALAPPEFGGSERRTEGETDNPLLKYGSVNL